MYCPEFIHTLHTYYNQAYWATTSRDTEENLKNKKWRYGPGFRISPLVISYVHCFFMYFDKKGFRVAERCQLCIEMQLDKLMCHSGIAP